MSKIVIIFFFCSFIYSQDSNTSIYFGRGTGHNIGGDYGLGYEYYTSNYSSFSFTLGYINVKLPEHSDASNIDFDLGIKFYPVNYFSIGMNYGLINYFHSSIKEDDVFIFNEFKKFHGISFGLGLKQKLSESISVHFIVSKRLGDKSKINPFTGKKSNHTGFSILLHYSI